MPKVGQKVTVHGEIAYIGDDHIIVKTSDDSWFKVENPLAFDLHEEAVEVPKVVDNTILDNDSHGTNTRIPNTVARVVNVNAGDSIEPKTE